MASTTPKSFIEVLEAEIRADLRKEIRAELEAEMATQLGRRAPGRSSFGKGETTNPAVLAAGRLETWLAANLGGPATFNLSLKSSLHAKKNAYGAPRSQATPGASTGHAVTESVPATAASVSTSVITTFTAKTPEQLVARELLNRQSPTKLAATFTEDELKSVWRKAALKTHPDRFVGSDSVTQLRMTALFRELADAYATLLALTENSEHQAA